jgi:hypothetical protein
MTDDLVARLLAAIQEREDKANEADEDHRTASDSWHTRQCGYAQGEFVDPCECEVPDQVLRLCQAHRKIIDQYQAAKTRPDELLAQRAHGSYVLEAEAALKALHAVILALAEGYGFEAASAVGVSSSKEQKP